MTGSPEVLVVGVDAGDRDVVAELVERGSLPTLSGLFSSGSHADLINPFGMFSGPVWPTIATGVGPAQHRAWTWRPLTAGTYRLDYRGPSGPVARPTYWAALGRQGVRSTTLDVPNVAPQEEPLATQIVGWTQHDRRRNLAVSPPSLARDLARLPAVDPDDHRDEHGERGERAELEAELHESIDRKVSMVRWLQERLPADVVTVVFGEAHCAGHHFWPLRRAGDEQRHPAGLAGLGDVFAEVYEHLDRAIGALLRDLAPRHVVVILSHGIADHVTMPHLLDPVLKRLDATLGRPAPVALARDHLRRAPNRAARTMLRAVHLPIEHLAHHVDGTRRFFPLPNFPAFGAIRLNLEGREPRGRVSAVDAEVMLGFLERELLALVDADTGTPVVRAVHRGEALHPGGADAGMFDLLVEWDLSRPCAGVRSPTIGEVRADRHEIREGGHAQDGRIVVSGPGVPVGPIDAVRAEDVAPTIAALVGCRLHGVEGVPFVPLEVSDQRAATRPSARR